MNDLSWARPPAPQPLKTSLAIRDVQHNPTVDLALILLFTLAISTLVAGFSIPARADNVILAGSMEGLLTINPGDTLRAGYDVMIPGTHPAATVTLSGGQLQLNVMCTNGSAQTLTMTFPSQSYTIATNNNSWYPTADQTNAASYEASLTVPSSLCGGNPGRAVNGATFAGDLDSTDAADSTSMRFHYSNNSPGGWCGAYQTKPPKPTTSKTPAFAREVIVDHQRVSGEPSIAIDGTDRIYVSAPWGFSTTASFLWRSTDHGQSFHLVPANIPEPPLFGKPITCVGGGDSGLAVDSVNRLYFTDLQGTTDVTGSVSSDEGTTFSTTCNEANDTSVDRPWIATFGDPANGGAVYHTVDAVEQCVTECDQELGEAGNNVVEITRSTDGTTFTPLPGQHIEPDGIVSGIVTDPKTGDVYIAHTGLVDSAGHLGGSDANGNSNAVIVIRFPGGYNGGVINTSIPVGGSLCQVSPSTCTTNVAYSAPLTPSNCDLTQTTPVSGCASTVLVGQDFSPIAIDRAGNLYVVWSQSPVDSTGNNSGSSQIYMAVSTDHGAHWGAPVRVSATTPSLQTNLFGWIAAGDPGRVDVVWYGTPTLAPPGSVNDHWSVMMAQSLNAITNGKPNPNPAFTTTQVSEISNHFGAICTFGITCTAGGDRGLLDFLSVTVGLQGEANVVWADGVNRNFNGGTTSALVAFARQTSGPSLYANIGQVKGTAPASNSGAGSADAFYSANGTATLATGNLIINSASVSMPDAAHYRFTLNIADGATLQVPPTLGGTDAVWLVRWEVPDPAGAGHTYFAAMESDLGQTPTFYDGETSTFNTTHGKMMTYNPGNTIQGSFASSSTGGVITLNVPVADVGANPNAVLYSITAVTATQLVPSSTGSVGVTVTGTSTGPIFNQIDASSPFDFRP